MDDSPHILVVDDDTRLRELLQKYLMEQGFRVSTARDAGNARAKLASLEFDLLVLDIMMPGESGLELTEALRQDRATPILLLTAMGETEDRIRGLEIGADDYMSKPFEPRELVLRIDAILRRARQAPTTAQPAISFGEFRFDLEREELIQGETFVHLTTNEVSLLKTLALRPGVPMSREALTLESRVTGGARTIDVQMTRLRRKIEEDPRYPRYLQTVRGEGYVLMAD